MKKVTSLLVQIFVFMAAGLNGCMEFDDSVTSSPSAITYPNLILSNNDIPCEVKLSAAQSVIIVEPNITFTFLGKSESSGNGGDQDIPILLDVSCPAYRKTIVLSIHQPFPGYTMEDGSQLTVGLKRVDIVNGTYQITIWIGRWYTR